MRATRGLIAFVLAALVALLPVGAASDVYVPVILFNSSGPEHAPATPTPTVTPTTPAPTPTTPAEAPTLPAAPSSVQVEGLSTTKVRVTWADNSSNETGFLVERLVGASYSALAGVEANITAFEDTGLAAGTNYIYRVRAKGAAGYSDYSAPGSGATQSPGTGKPAAPTNLRSSNITSHSVYLQWDDNSDNEAGFHLYMILYPGDFVEIGAGVLGPDVNSVTVVDMYAGAEYGFYVTAYNANGASAATTTVHVHTIATAVTATRFVNSSSHPVVSLVVDGVEEFPVSPYGILPGGSYDVELAPGTHTMQAANGFWQDDGTRFEMYTWSGTINQEAGVLGVVTFSDPTMQQLLTNFQSSAYWSGMYWGGDPLVFHSAGYCFYGNGAYRFYVDGQQHSTGTYWETYRGSLFDKFRTSAGHEGMLYEAYGQFDMMSSPPGGQFTEYVRDDGATCPAAP